MPLTQRGIAAQIVASNTMAASVAGHGEPAVHYLRKICACKVLQPQQDRRARGGDCREVSMKWTGPVDGRLVALARDLRGPSSSDLNHATPESLLPRSSRASQTRQSQMRYVVGSEKHGSCTGRTTENQKVARASEPFRRTPPAATLALGALIALTIAIPACCATYSFGVSVPFAAAPGFGGVTEIRIGVESGAWSLATTTRCEWASTAARESGAAAFTVAAASETVGATALIQMPACPAAPPWYQLSVGSRDTLEALTSMLPTALARLVPVLDAQMVVQPGVLCLDIGVRSRREQSRIPIEAEAEFILTPTQGLEGKLSLSSCFGGASADEGAERHAALYVDTALPAIADTSMRLVCEASQNGLEVSCVPCIHPFLGVAAGEAQATWTRELSSSSILQLSLQGAWRSDFGSTAVLKGHVSRTCTTLAGASTMVELAVSCPEGLVECRAEFSRALQRDVRTTVSTCSRMDLDQKTLEYSLCIAVDRGGLSVQASWDMSHGSVAASVSLQLTTEGRGDN